ncbi:MAG: spore gernimation protein GerC [Firmicutes bacterium]|nr:spore gernimation protein GerC [Bacillota bacterium]
MSGWVLRSALCGCALLFLLTGCWDITQPEPLTIPVLMAVDRQSKGLRVAVEADVPQLMHSPGSSSGSGSTRPTWVVQGTGNTLTEALRHTGLDFPNRNPLTFAHLRVVVLSQAVLQGPAFSGVIDRLARAPYLHRTFWLLATAGPAAPFAETVNPVGPDPVEVLDDVLRALKHDGSAYPTRFYRCLERWENRPFAVVPLPLLALRSQPGLPGASDFAVVGAVVTAASGAVGRWSPDEVATWGLLTNRRPSVLLTVPSGKGQWVLQVVSEHFELHVTRQALEVKGAVGVSIDEVDGHPNPLPLSTLSQQAAQQLAQRAVQLVHWTQVHRVDAFTLYPHTERLGPLASPPAPAAWMARYARLPVRASVRVTVRNAGSLLPTHPILSYHPSATS